MNKISIRFFNDKEVRAIWDDKTSKLGSVTTQFKFTAPDGKKRLALTDKINDREMFMNGIDYSNYYESTIIDNKKVENEIIC